MSAARSASSLAISFRSSSACSTKAGSGAGGCAMTPIDAAGDGRGSDDSWRTSDFADGKVTLLVSAVGGGAFPPASLTGTDSVSPRRPSVRVAGDFLVEAGLGTLSSSGASPFGARSRKRASNWPKLTRSPPLTLARWIRLPLMKVPLEDFRSTSSYPLSSCRINSAWKPEMNVLSMTMSFLESLPMVNRSSRTSKTNSLPSLRLKAK